MLSNISKATVERRRLRANYISEDTVKHKKLDIYIIHD